MGFVSINVTFSVPLSGLSASDSVGGRVVRNRSLLMEVCILVRPIAELCPEAPDVIIVERVCRVIE